MLSCPLQGWAGTHHSHHPVQNGSDLNGPRLSQSKVSSKDQICDCSSPQPLVNAAPGIRCPELGSLGDGSALLSQEHKDMRGVMPQPGKGGP